MELLVVLLCSWSWCGFGGVLFAACPSQVAGMQWRPETWQKLRERLFCPQVPGTQGHQACMLLFPIFCMVTERAYWYCQVPRVARTAYVVISVERLRHSNRCGHAKFLIPHRRKSYTDCIHSDFCMFPKYFGKGPSKNRDTDRYSIYTLMRWKLYIRVDRWKFSTFRRYLNTHNLMSISIVKCTNCTITITRHSVCFRFFCRFCLEETRGACFLMLSYILSSWTVR